MTIVETLHDGRVGLSKPTHLAMLPDMPLRAVVFDLFDTLVDLRFEDLPHIEHDGRRLPASAQLVHAAIGESAEIEFSDYVLAERAVHEALAAPRYKEGREVPTHERFTAVLAELGVQAPDLPARLTDIHMGALHAAVRVPPHHEDLLAALHEQVRLGLCSNFSHSPTAHRVLDESGLGAHLDALVVSDAVGWRKPRREIFEVVLGQLGVAPDEVLHVGDNLSADIAGAAAVGLRTAWVTRRVREPEERLGKHEGPAPDFVVADLAELCDLIDRAG